MEYSNTRSTSDRDTLADILRPADTPKLSVAPDNAVHPNAAVRASMLQYAKERELARTPSLSAEAPEFRFAPPLVASTTLSSVPMTRSIGQSRHPAEYQHRPLQRTSPRIGEGHWSTLHLGSVRDDPTRRFGTDDRAVFPPFHEDYFNLCQSAAKSAHASESSVAHASSTTSGSTDNISGDIDPDRLRSDPLFRSAYLAPGQPTLARQSATVSPTFTFKPYIPTPVYVAPGSSLPTSPVNGKTASVSTPANYSYDAHYPPLPTTKPSATHASKASALSSSTASLHIDIPAEYADIVSQPPMSQPDSPALRSDHGSTPPVSAASQVTPIGYHSEGRDGSKVKSEAVKATEKQQDVDYYKFHQSSVNDEALLPGSPERAQRARAMLQALSRPRVTSPQGGQRVSSGSGSFGTASRNSNVSAISDISFASAMFEPGYGGWDDLHHAIDPRDYHADHPALDITQSSQRAWGHLPVPSPNEPNLPAHIRSLVQPEIRSIWDRSARSPAPRQPVAQATRDSGIIPSSDYLDWPYQQTSLAAQVQRQAYQQHQYRPSTHSSYDLYSQDGISSVDWTSLLSNSTTSTVDSGRANGASLSSRGLPLPELREEPGMQIVRCTEEYRRSISMFNSFHGNSRQAKHLAEERTAAWAAARLGGGLAVRDMPVHQLAPSDPVHEVLPGPPVQFRSNIQLSRPASPSVCECRELAIRAGAVGPRFRNEPFPCQHNQRLSGNVRPQKRFSANKNPLILASDALLSTGLYDSSPETP
ncbi:uncharacterized protein MKK02DRAFT_30554 [Dioszegia hungarica]|uniref:Uncharacterized protein n=1 Tax=Dioszegia hungarica TaxID=4972 RepID=A0AA38H5C9_9TREE|nr:uncharacterized protein MKK02DRAFT_30554 [Dioszegia hungarica]KAI9632824.1 hypothetical protein MKK02DRAFT_30554 [Dioszegia hungarica]